MLAFAFAPGMGFERYVDYALDVPLYFVKRGSVYHDVAGASFRDLLHGKLAALPGERATVSDWANHLSTIFPEVRLKRYLEMRGADVGPPERIVALAAFCLGVFYDADALAAASDLTRDWTAGDLQRLRADVPRLGLKARIGARPLIDAAREAVAIARGGLRTARPARRRRPRRDRLSGAAGANRRRRPHPGRGLDRSLQRPVEGRRRSGFQRSGDLKTRNRHSARQSRRGRSPIHVRFIRCSSNRQRRSLWSCNESRT